MAVALGYSRATTAARSLSSRSLKAKMMWKEVIMMNTEPMEILLVEDNEDDILLEQEALADAKLINLMCVVRDGEEAMVYLRRQGKYQNVKMPGLVLLDINM